MNVKYNKDEILERGVTLMRQGGYHKTGLSDILKTVGIPKGSFYNFFENKEDFTIQVIDTYASYMAFWIKKYLEDENFSPFQRLVNFYQFTIDANEKENWENGCLVANMSNEAAGHSEAFASATKSAYSRWIGLIATCVDLGQKAGEIRTDLSPEEIAEYLHTSVIGAMSRMKSQRSGSPMSNWLKLSFMFIKPN